MVHMQFSFNRSSQQVLLHFVSVPLSSNPGDFAGCDHSKMYACSESLCNVTTLPLSQSLTMLGRQLIKLTWALGCIN